MPLPVRFLSAKFNEDKVEGYLVLDSSGKVLRECKELPDCLSYLGVDGKFTGGEDGNVLSVENFTGEGIVGFDLSTLGFRVTVNNPSLDFFADLDEAYFYVVKCPQQVIEKRVESVATGVNIPFTSVNTKYKTGQIVKFFGRSFKVSGAFSVVKNTQGDLINVYVLSDTDTGRVEALVPEAYITT